MNINKVFYAGNLTAAPELRYIPNGTAITTFTIASNRKYKSGEEMKQETTFMPIEVWGKTGENCKQYLDKGKGCFVEGRLKVDSWEDKDTGQKKQRVKIVAENVQFLSAPQKKTEEQEEFQGIGQDENVPF